MNYKILKIHLFILFVFLSIIDSYSQNKEAKTSSSFFIEGYYKGVKSKYLILSYLNNKGVFIKDSGKIVNGRFSFSGNIEEPTYAGLRGDICTKMSNEYLNHTNIYIEPKRMKLVIEEGHFKTRQVTGSKTQNQYDSLEKAKHSIYDQMAPLSSRLDRLVDSLDFAHKKKDAPLIKNIMKKRRIVFSEMKPYRNQLNILDIEFIGRHPNSYLSADLLSDQFFRYKLKKDSVKLFLNNFSPEIQNSYNGKKIRLWLNKDKIIPIGTVFPNIDGTDRAGRKLSTDSMLKGKYTLIIFWASWCPPCRKLSPVYKAIYSKYHNRGLGVIAVTRDREKKRWLSAIKKDTLDAFKHIYPNNSNNQKLPDTFGLSSIPADILLKGNKIIAKYAGADNEQSSVKDLENKLKEIFIQHPQK